MSGMSILKMLMGNSTHVAEKYWPAHDGTLNVGEARRGRGKSFGAVVKCVEWFRARMDDIRNGNIWAKVYTNIKLRHRQLAQLLCKEGVTKSLQEALDLLRDRLIYVTSWDVLLTAYDSLLLLDEFNRNLNIYDMSKQVQENMKVVHDWLQQTRKHVLTIWFYVQDVEWLKTQVLSLTDVLWRAKRVRIRGTMQIKYFPWYGSDPYANGKDGPLNRTAEKKMKFHFSMWYARCYDTKQAVITWEPITKFTSFGDLSDYMINNGLKPAETPQKADYMTWDEELAWWRDVQRVRIGRAAHVIPAAPLPPAQGGGGAAGWPCDRCRSLVVLAATPPAPLTALPVAFPSAS